MRIEKKVWPEFFGKLLSGEKTFELRLADFELNKGDVLVLKEYDPEKKKYTGRELERECKSVMKVNPIRFHDKEEVEKHGIYVIGF